MILYVAVLLPGVVPFPGLRLLSTALMGICVSVLRSVHHLLARSLLPSPFPILSAAEVDNSGRLLVLMTHLRQLAGVNESLPVPSAWESWSAVMGFGYLLILFEFLLSRYVHEVRTLEAFFVREVS